MRRAPAWLLFLGCGTAPGLPPYLRDLPRTEGETRRVIEEILRELGPETRVDLLEDCFFVASNDAALSFEHCKGTISRLFRHLYGNFFTRRPGRPIRVYIFCDGTTYEEYCRKTYDKPPPTPFGFYVAGERKMVMDISTGRGTLAHELVHPLLAEDLPDVPSWFNEGFASLYEQSAERGGKLLGLVNWRLPALQKALEAGQGVSLRELLSMSPGEFYGDERRVNYASARYLCLYLQETGRLVEFYKAFRGDIRREPAGISALEKTTGKKLEALEAVWREWVLGLRYER